MVIKPVTSHAAISSAGESTSRAISAETRKMPDPIIEPITSMVELVRPRPLTKSRSGASSRATVAGLVSMLMKIGDQWPVASHQPKQVVRLLVLSKTLPEISPPRDSPHERLRHNWQLLASH